jgi:hypothetical protein
VRKGPHRQGVQGVAWCGSPGGMWRGVHCLELCCMLLLLLWGMWHGVGQRGLLLPSTAVATPACAQTIQRLLLLWGVMSRRGSNGGNSQGYAIAVCAPTVAATAWRMTAERHAWCTGHGACHASVHGVGLVPNLKMCGGKACYKVPFDCAHNSNPF